MTHGTYYHMAVNNAEADLTIYGDISEHDRWNERATSAYTLAKKLESLEGVRQINVNINSLGGDVKEGIAIYNALQRHPAKVVTRCDGWACSIASVIFMAGDERIMYPTSLLMIHNAWTSTWGANSAEMRKLADDLDTITESSKKAYMEHISISEEELTRKMDAESWINPEQAVEWGFATKIESLKEPPKGSIHQSFRSRLFEILTAPPAQDAAPAKETFTIAELAALVAGYKAEVNEAGDEDPEADPEPEEDPGPDDGDEDPGEDPEEDPVDEKSEQSCRSFFLSAFKN